MIHLRLVKAGYGTLEEVKTFTAREVLQALNFEKFNDDFERAWMELNKE